MGSQVHDRGGRGAGRIITTKYGQKEESGVCKSLWNVEAKEGKEEKEEPGEKSRRKVKARRKLHLQCSKSNDKNSCSKLSFSKSEYQNFDPVIKCVERGHPGSELTTTLKRSAEDNCEGVTGVKRSRQGSISRQ